MDSKDQGDLNSSYTSIHMPSIDNSNTMYQKLRRHQLKPGKVPDPYENIDKFIAKIKLSEKELIGQELLIAKEKILEVFSQAPTVLDRQLVYDEMVEKFIEKQKENISELDRSTPTNKSTVNR